MRDTRFTRLELSIMQTLWERGPTSIREIQESISEPSQPAYTTVQTTIYRMEGKNAVRRVKKIGNAHIFEAVVTRDATRGRLVDELLGLFGGRAQPMMSHLIDSGKLTLEDVKEAERALRKLQKQERPE